MIPLPFLGSGFVPTRSMPAALLAYGWARKLSSRDAVW
jgi:hypothetical protein